MRQYLQTDEWNIIENGFHADNLRMSESIFSLGNGRFGERGFFEEGYSSDHYRGSFVTGITFWDKTRVGWWKNGFPRYYTRMPNAANWSLIKVRLIDEELDLAECDVHEFQRRLDMKAGIAYRDMEVSSPRGHRLRIHVEHICNMAHPDLCTIKYGVTSVNYTGRISLVPLIDAQDICQPNADGVKEWNILRSQSESDVAYLWTQTRREDSQVCYAMNCIFSKNDKPLTVNAIRIEKEAQVGYSTGVDVKPGDTILLEKYVSIISSIYYDREELVDAAQWKVHLARKRGWNVLETDHRKAWLEIWDEADVEIDGDPEVQQAIRFNIFQLYQTYRGDDARLNIGPKGLTGERYGGNTYWNTELCCVPFFLLSTPKPIVRNLLIYRYNQLQKAIDNAKKLGFTGGAALYPQVTSNGEECHNEWEITFEEIHRNGIIVYAIIEHAISVGNYDYLARYGLEVMIAVARFWAQRVSFSQPKQKYVILGVTGPNEYENNVDNNWYTNLMCHYCFETVLASMDLVEKNYPDDYARVLSLTHLDKEKETAHWCEIMENLYFPEDRERGIFVQNDGFLDKELCTVDTIPEEERPINQHWSWDRILRSPFVKQSDVILGLYLFYFKFDKETMRRNFEFYEPMTVHESSLSPYIHAVLAAYLGKMDRAYELFLQATRLDLDDYNNEADYGLHITSMPGSWLALVRGFGGVALLQNAGQVFHVGGLCLNPRLPKQWMRYAFKLNHHGMTVAIEVTGKEITITLVRGEKMNISVYGKPYQVNAGKPLKVGYQAET